MEQKTTSCETQRLKNLHMYWIQTQLHNKHRSYWKLQYTIHEMETCHKHRCRTLTDLPYIIAKITFQLISTTITERPNSGFLIPSIGFWQWWMTFGFLPSYVSVHDTLSFGDMLGPHHQAFFQSCHYMTMIIYTVIKLRLMSN
jgi:hypothetical protein